MNKATWVVIADGAKAHIYHYKGGDQSLELVKGGDLTHELNASHDILSNSTGHMHTGGSDLYARSALERPSDPHEHEKEIFAHEISDFLKRREHEVDRLVLIAAPKMLGNLRKQLPEQIKDKVFAEIDKDLTNIPQQELSQHLQNIL